MKTKLNTIIIMTALLSMMTACHMTPKRVAFNSLATVAAGVDTAMSIAGDAYRAGKITDTQKSGILVKYKKYQSSANLALDAVAFDTTKLAPADLQSLASDVIDAVNEFTNSGLPTFAP